MSIVGWIVLAVGALTGASGLARLWWQRRARDRVLEIELHHVETFGSLKRQSYQVGHSLHSKAPAAAPPADVPSMPSPPDAPAPHPTVTNPFLPPGPHAPEEDGASPEYPEPKESWAVGVTRVEFERPFSENDPPGTFWLAKARGPTFYSALDFDSVYSALEPEVFAERKIDAHLLAPNFAPGEIAALTVTLRLPTSVSLGQFQGAANVNVSSPVAIALETKGFTLISEPPLPILLTEDRDSAPAAFTLRIEEAQDRWLHILLSQDGHPVGELVINDFTAFGNEGKQVEARTLPVREADLSLIVRAADAKVIASSPRRCASLDFQSMPGITSLATPFQTILRDRLRALYDSSANAAETARELQIVGVELARCLSTELVALFRRPDIRTVMLRHDEEFDFPLELCYFDDAQDPFFLGDRIAICRWYLGVTNPPDVVSKHIGRVAFLRGDDPAAPADEAMLQRLYPDRITAFATRGAVRENLFKTRDFDLIQFTGHCTVNAQGLGGLQMADGSFIRLVDIGQLLSERQFAEAQPFVLLNACASAQPYIGLTARDSFAHRFVSAQACAFIGTLWPVAGPVANEFADAFHKALASQTVGQALLSAKLAVVARAAQAADAAPAPDIAAVARQVAARSYCLFAHPDLRVAA